jgi:hypothetical protein
VTNGSDRFARISECLDQRDSFLVYPQIVRIDDATGQNQRIEPVGRLIVDHQIGGDSISPIICVLRADITDLGRCDMDRVARLL